MSNPQSAEAAIIPPQGGNHWHWPAAPRYIPAPTGLFKMIWQFGSPQVFGRFSLAEEQAMRSGLYGVLTVCFASHCGGKRLPPQTSQKPQSPEEWGSQLACGSHLWRPPPKCWVLCPFGSGDLVLQSNAKTHRWREDWLQSLCVDTEHKSYLQNMEEMRLTKCNGWSISCLSRHPV